MSETMVGNFLDFAPLPAQPVNDIEPPPDRSSAPTVTRAGITFMYGPEDDATTFLDALPASATGATQATPRPTPGGGQATMLDRPLGDTLVHGRAATPAQPPFNPQATRIQGNQDAQATQDIPLGQDAQSTQEVPGIFNTDATNPDQAATSPPFDPHATLLDPSASEALAQAASGSRPPTDPRPQGVPPTPGAQDPRAQAGGGQNAPDPRAQGQSPADQYGQGVDPSARGAQDPRAQAGGQNAADPTARGGREPQGVAGAGFDPHATLLDSGALGGQGAGDPRGQEPRGVQPGGFDAQATMMDASVDPFATALDGRGMPATMVDGGGAGVAPSVLLVGGAHTGQRRLARMIALIVGDGRLQVSDAEELRGLALERLATLFDPGGATVMIERLDAAVLDAADPKVFLRTLRTVRGRARTAMVATCDPRAFRRLAQDYPELEGTFRVFRMPEIRDVEQRATLLRVLADERRASLDTVAWEVAREDFGRLRGPGDLTAARLVEAYLERAVQRALGRGAGARERLVLEAEDLSGIAESIEPSLRSAGDVDGYLRTLNQMIGMAEVKAEVERLAAEPEPVNYVFEGPPGTGKATVAGIIGGILGALGTLPSGHVIQCRPVHLIGRDALETELRVAGMVQQADGGVLLVQEAGKLTPEVVSELFRGLREQQLMLVLAGTDLGGFLRANPDIQATFQRLGFVPPSDRELVQLFAQLAENKLYALDEELRVELMTRIAREREGQGFAYARTIREWFEETIARQARRLAGIQGADAMTVARLTSRDLPESNLDRILGELHQTRRADPGGGGA